jgi:hypothetical protein
MADQMRFAVTPAQIGAARAKLAEAGFNLAGDTGVLQKDGYRIGYAVEQGRLILDLLAKPRFVPMMVVKVKIRSALASEEISEVNNRDSSASASGRILALTSPRWPPRMLLVLMADATLAEQTRKQD